jgi:drug/metabolite transporter (DMT)-like permease
VTQLARQKARATSSTGASPAATWLALGIVYVVWGSTYLAIRVMVETVPPLIGAGLRFVVAGVLLLAVLALRGRPTRVPIAQLGSCALVGALLAGGGNGLVTVAEQDVPSGLAALLVASVPLFIVVYRTLAADRPSGFGAGGVALGFCGVAVLLLPGGRPAGVPLGPTLLLLLAAASWAAGSFAAQRLAMPSDPLVSTGWQLTFGGALLVLASPGEWGGLDPGAFSLRSAAAFAYLVLAGSLVAYTAYAWLLQHAPIGRISTYAYVNPLVAVALGWAVLGEQVRAATLAGAALIVASVALILREAPRPRAPAAEGGAATPPGRPAPARSAR